MRFLHRSDWILALAALVLAVATYIYVNDAIIRNQNKPYDPSYKLIKLTAKSVPIKVRFASNPPEGYRLVQEKVAVNPGRLVVIGPEALLDDTSTAEAAILDISQSTKKVLKSIPIESVAGIHLAGEPTFVEVVIPIEKLDVNP